MSNTAMTVAGCTTLALLAASCAATDKAVAQLPAPLVSPAPAAQMQYDTLGRPTVQTMGGQTRWQYIYDTLGRPVLNVNALGGRTAFAFDGSDNLLHVTDPRSLITSWSRDGLGQSLSLTSPDTGFTAMAHDAAGNLLQRTDSRGAVGNFSYDALNRIKSANYNLSGQPSQAYGWTYDQTGATYGYGVGRLTSISYPEFNSSGGSSVRLTSFGYDSNGFLSRARQSNSAGTLETSYSRDAVGNVRSIRYPSGLTVRLTYLNGKPTSLSISTSSAAAPVAIISQITYRPFEGAYNALQPGWVWNTATGPQVHQKEYDTAGRLIRYRLGAGLRDIAYDYAGRITNITHRDATTGVVVPSLNQMFYNDNEGRLLFTADAKSWTSWEYDNNGNRTVSYTGPMVNGVAGSGAAGSGYAIASSNNRVLSVNAPVSNYAYDAAGNEQSNSGKARVLTHGADGRLAASTLATGSTYYSYNNFGQRTRKAYVGGITRTFVYGERHDLLGEYTNNNVAAAEYIWLGDTPVAVVRSGIIYLIHADHLNTPRVVVDMAGRPRWTWLGGDPFGASPANANPSGLGDFQFPLRFPGQYADSETGLWYNINRYYDAALGRYIQSDPIGLAGGINTYAYVENNPLSYADPDGLAPSPGDSSLYPPTHNCTCMTKCLNASHNEAYEACAFPAGTLGRISRIPGVGIPIGYACQKIVVRRQCEMMCKDFCSGKGECPPAFRDP